MLWLDVSLVDQEWLNNSNHGFTATTQVNLR